MAVHLDPEASGSTDDPEPQSSRGAPPRRVQCPGSPAVDLVLGPGGVSRMDGSGIAWIIEHARLACLALDLTGELRVRVVGDAEMASTHRAYLDDPTTTDVMTFDLREGGASRDRVLDVDVHVCIDEAQRHARLHGHPVERELLLYIIHGVLHCLGHDDHDEAGFAAMHALEDDILERIGVGATFGASSGDPEPAS